MARDYRPDLRDKKAKAIERREYVKLPRQTEDVPLGRWPGVEQDTIVRGLLTRIDKASKPTMRKFSWEK